MKIYTKLLSYFIAVSMLISSAAAIAYADDGQSGDWFEMEDGIAVRIVNNGASASNAYVDDIFSVQFWIKNINPQSVTIPLAWNSDVVTVVDKTTGEAVTDGRKTESDLSKNAGFMPGIKCYDTSIDDDYMPIYWNGKPVYSENNDENARGYPYLNSAAGLYQFFYFVVSPTKATVPQMFLEVSFKAISEGDPNFHFATSEDGEDLDCFDLSSPEGMKLAFPLSLGDVSDIDETKTNIEIYTDKVEFPPFRIINESELDKPPSLPPVELSPSPTATNKPSSSPTAANKPSPTPTPTNKPANNGSSASSGANPSTPEPTTTISPLSTDDNITYRDAEHLDAWPYTEPVRCGAVINRKKDKPLSVTDGYILSPGSLSEAINEAAAQARAKAVLVNMPDKLLDTDEYKIVIYCSNLDDMILSGLYMLYVETPCAYVGINPSVVLQNVKDDSVLTLSVRKTETGFYADMEIDGQKKTNFESPIYRFILPYTAGDGALVPFVNNAFGSEYFGEYPLSVNRYYPDKKALVILSSVGGLINIQEKEPVQFSDIGDVEWAHEQISLLSQTGIINGMGNGTFAPNQAVTREQLAVMITSAFGAYQSDPVTGFADMKKDSVFYPYVASANMLGIISGISDTEFRGNIAVSRQDLAVMVYRACELLGVSLPKTNDTSEFADDEEISDYAKTAVYELAQAGIINGLGDNRFEPKNTASRAESARIIGLVYEFIKNLI